ncbi:MAG: recombination regulator RecX [Ruminococcus sp.]|nr:recombination regulator RecX [Ruminococcus sp.]
MKITAVEKYKGSTYRVDFDEGESAYLNLEIISKFNIRAGLDLPLSEWEQIKQESDFRRARERALYLLDRRDYSFVEMFKKLRQNYDEDLCYRVMQRLVELGAINDRRYAQGLARHYIEVKLFGRRRAFQEMRLKGLTKEVIDIALSEYDEGVEERLHTLIEKKYLRIMTDEKGINRAKNSLVRYGYDYSDINKAFKQIELEYDEQDG